MQVARLTPRARRAAAIVAAAALLTPLAGASVARAQAQSGGAGPRIGVVNVAVVSSKIQELKDFAAHIHNQQDLLDSSAKGHQAQLTDMQQRLHNLKPDSDQFDDAVKQLTEKAAEFNMEDQLKKAELLREVNKQNKALFLEVQQVVADIAKQKGLDLVIVEPEVQLPTSVQGVNPEQLNNLISQKTVLYASPRIDLTDEVTTALDAAFTAHGGGMTPAH